MKIVEKIYLASNPKPLLVFANRGLAPVILPLFHGHSIIGRFKAYVDIARITEDRDFDDSFPYSRIIYDPYYVKCDDGSIADEFEETYPEHNFRPSSIPDLEDCECYETQEEIDHYKSATQNQIDYYKTYPGRQLIDEDIPITIPSGVEYLSVIVRSGDTVAIHASYTVKHVIIDDYGNELSLDEAIDRKIAEKDYRGKII